MPFYFEGIDQQGAARPNRVSELSVQAIVN